MFIHKVLMASVVVLSVSGAIAAIAGEDTRSDDDRGTPVAQPMKAWMPIVLLRQWPSDADRENHDGLMHSLPGGFVETIVVNPLAALSDDARLAHDAELATLAPDRRDAVAVLESRPLTAMLRLDNDARNASEPPCCMTSASWH